MTQLVTFEGWEVDATHNEEPRVSALEVARRAGLTRESNINRIIDSNAEELSAHGEIVFRSLKAQNGPGRPTAEYWLNECQVIALMALLRTPTAKVLRIGLVRLFDAWRKGLLKNTPPSSEPRMPDLAVRMRQDKRAMEALRCAIAVAAVATGRSRQSIHGELRKIWGVGSVFNIPLPALELVLKTLSDIASSPFRPRLSADSRQLSLF